MSWFKKITETFFGKKEENKKNSEIKEEKSNIQEKVFKQEEELPTQEITNLQLQETEVNQKQQDESQNQANLQEEKSKKGWFSKVIDTLNSPIEIRIETNDDNDSWLGKLKGNISIGLGEPIKKETSEEREKWKQTLKERLYRTRQAFTEKIERLLRGRKKIDEDLLEEIEEILLESDVGIEMTEKIISKLRQMAKDKRFLPEEVMPSLFDFLKEQLELEESRIIIDDSKLNIIMMVGVNGTGKTTTTGKIAAKLKISNYSVMMAAADTFRAAAIDQLDIWSKRAQVPLIKHQENSDAAAVVFDAIRAAKSRKVNVLLIDTAGRLHNKVNLMEELRKIRRIIDKEASDAKVEVLLVLDGTTGQNGLKQAMVFAEAVKLTGVVLTKLDGTAKGGVIFSIRDTLNIPIKLVGVGEGIEDLRDFEPQIFIEALFSKKTENLIEETTKKVET
jgi:fused signal recognition particle receptor